MVGRLLESAESESLLNLGIRVEALRQSGQRPMQSSLSLVPQRVGAPILRDELDGEWWVRRLRIV